MRLAAGALSCATAAAGGGAAGGRLPNLWDGRMDSLMSARRPRRDDQRDRPVEQDIERAAGLAPRTQDAMAVQAKRAERASPALEMADITNFPTPSEAQLRTLFGLTASEARLARHLAAGDAIEEVADALGIKLTTARSKLAVIFSKTGIRRQTKLVAVLSRIAHL